MTVSALACTTLLRVGEIRVLLSDRPDDIVDAQRLRYRVFTVEPGFGDAIGDAESGREADRFDAYCEHLVVRHETDGVIGCARVLSPRRAEAAGGWYSATEFDLAELAPISSATVELGRACIDADHRRGSVAALMWAAILQYLDRGGYRYLIGCVSVPLGGPTPGARLRATRDLLLDRYAAPYRVHPLAAPEIDGVPLDRIEPAAQQRLDVALPPLMRAYLRLGSTVCGEPAIDPVFGVGDFLTMLDREHGNQRYLERLTSTVNRLGDNR